VEREDRAMQKIAPALESSPDPWKFLGWERIELKLRRTLRGEEVLRPWWTLKNSLILEGSKGERVGCIYTYHKNGENREGDSMLLDLGVHEFLAIRKNFIPFIYGKMLEDIYTNLESEFFAL
jgi:hypothetical protein